MNHAILLLLVLLLSGCSYLTPQRPAAGEAEDLLLQGIHSLTEKNSLTVLQNLIKQYPDSPQAVAAMQLLKTYRKQPPKDDDKAELEKLRSENKRLHEDLEKLRQLLIKSEKRAS